MKSSSDAITLRNIPQIAEARKIADKSGLSVTDVVRLALENGLPVVDANLASLRRGEPQLTRAGAAPAI